MRVLNLFAPLLIAVLFLALDAPASAQNAEYPYDYLSGHPELLDRLPTPEQIHEEAPGESEAERDAWRAATYEKLVWALKDMLGPRRFRDADTWRPKERAAIDRYRDAYRAVSDPYEYGYWYGKVMEFGGRQQRAIYERYLPEYIGWSEAKGRPVRSLAEVTTFAEDDALAHRHVALGLTLLGLLFVTGLCLRIANRTKTKKARAFTWWILVGTWVLAATLLVAFEIAPLVVVGTTVVFGIFLFLLVKMFASLILRALPPEGKAARKGRAEDFLRACTGLSEEDFTKSDRAARRAAIQREARDIQRSVTLSADFHHRQRCVGMTDGPLSVSLRNFTISRARYSMADNWHFLAGAALLYNEGKTSDRAFEIHALSLVYEDGVGQLANWSHWHAGTNHQQVRSAHDALRWIMANRYRTAQAVKEDLRVRLYELHQSGAFADTEEEEAIRTAGILAGVAS